MARAAYVGLFFLSASVAALVHTFGQHLLSQLSYVYEFFTACEHAPDAGACIANQFVYRISFSLSCFFVLTTLLSCAVARGCENVCCLFLFQLPIFAGILFASFFVPNGFYDGYTDVARVVSALFIVLQIVIILDYTYGIRDYLLSKMDEADQDDEARQSLLDADYTSQSHSSSRSLWEAAYLVAVVLCIAVSLAGIVLMYQQYAGCELNSTFITITTIASVVLMGLSLAPWVNVGLLPPSAMTLYLVLLCYQAVHSNPNDSCTNVDLASAKEQESSIVVNALVAALTITWTGWQTSSTDTHLFSLESTRRSRRSDSEVSDVERGEEDEDLASIGLTTARLRKHRKQDEDEDDKGVPDYQFHLLMVLASLYMSMVLTNWGSPNGSSAAIDASVSMWVKIGSQWATMGLYVWTLVAPCLFPDRDFGHY